MESVSEQRKIAVIGSNSFSGSDFIDLLLDDPGNEVIGVSRSPEKSALFLPYRRRASARYRFHQFDLNRDAGRIIELFDSFQPAYIVNFAAQSEVAPSWEHPEHWFQTNTVGLARLVNPLKDRSYLKKYVHISSPEVYGTCVGRVSEEAPVNPSTPYAASKAAADSVPGDTGQELRLPAGDHPGNECLRGPSATLEDHSAPSST